MQDINIVIRPDSPIIQLTHYQLYSYEKSLFNNYFSINDY